MHKWTDIEKAVAINKYYEVGYAKAAKAVGCSETSLRKWVKEVQTTGTIGGPPPKKCLDYCKNYYVPAKVRAEKIAAKEYGTKFVMDSAVKNYIEKECKVIFCQKRCIGPNKPEVWAPSISSNRQKSLKAKGAMSGCTDLIQNMPKYYKKNV